MTLDKYQIRSKEVQEVLKSPPKGLIKSGNTLIILFLSTFLVASAYYQIPVKTKYIFKTVNFRRESSGNLLNIYVKSPLNHNIQTGQKVKLNIFEFTVLDLGYIEATIKEVDLKNNKILLALNFNSDGSVSTDSDNKVFLNNNLIGVTEASSGHTSFWKLLIRKLNP